MDTNIQSCRRMCLLGCLLPVSILILMLGACYFLFFYNPMWLVDRRGLTAALNNGLLEECDDLLREREEIKSRVCGYYTIDKYPPAIASLRPRYVGVGDDASVHIYLWANHVRRLEKIFGKGEPISLEIYKDRQIESQIACMNEDRYVPYFRRKIVDRVYFCYPKRWEGKVRKHTDLIESVS
jgi:hypothetical protein